MNKLFLVLLIMILIAGLAFTGCVQPAETTPATAPVSTTPMPPVEETPKYGGVLKMGSGTIAVNIGWPVDIMGQALTVNQCCFDTLLRGDNKGNLYPWLAESYKVADDLKSITFSLRKGVKYHDGSDFNAEGAKWSLDNYINAKSAPLWASVDIIDDYTVRVNFREWQNTLPESFADTSIMVYMLSKAAFEKNGLDWLRLNPVGTGPFKFESFAADVNVKFVRNPDYWVQGKPYLDGIEYVLMSNSMTGMMALKSGQVDVYNPDLKYLADFVAEDFKTGVGVQGNSCLVPDTANADSPWANQKVREAVEYAIDHEAIAKAFGYGYWQATYQLPPRSTIIYDPDFPLARKYNPEKAKQLLTEAGYPDGFKTTIIIPPMVSNDITVAIQSDLAKVGIQVDLDPVDIGRFVTYLGPGTWQKNAAIIMAYPAQSVYFTGGLEFIYKQFGQSWLRPPEMTQAYNAALSSPTPDIKLIRALSDIITKGALLIPVHESAGATVQRPYVITDFNVRGSLQLWNTEDAWLNK